jgi:ketosteroid isomerase-like protein
MTPDSIRKLLERSYAAYDHGERSFLIDLLHDDVQWTLHGPPELLPVPNRITGKANLIAAFRKIDEVVEIMRNDLEVVVVENDRAAVVVDSTLRQRATGRVLRYKMAAFHRYRDGRQIEYQGFMDSVDLMQQTIGREIDLPDAYAESEARLPVK